MTESTARLILTISGATATVSYILAIFFGLRGDQALSILFFAFALTESAVAYLAYRRYTRLRGDRWHTELRDTEQKMSDLLSDQPSQANHEPKTDN